MIYDIQRFAEEDLPKQSIKSLKKGIRSLKKVIATHEAKILAPELFYPDEWNTLTDVQKIGNAQHWQKEIATARQAIFERIAELRKRGVEIDE